jgi:cytochrome P450
VPKEGKVIDGAYIPGGTEVTSHAYVVQRDRELYGEDAEVFRPERWLESKQKELELESKQFSFGMGSRICLGKDVALMELGKLLPEVSCSIEADTASCPLTIVLTRSCRLFDSLISKFWRRASM